MTIEHLPGTKINPLALLSRAMESAPTKVIVISCHDNDTWRVAWSAMPIKDLVFGATAAEIFAKQEMKASLDP